MHKKGFTPLDKNRRLRRNYLTGFTPLETIGRRQKAMVSLTGFTLIEILVSALILALVMTGLANIFLAGKRHILHTRSKIQAAELGRLFLAPLQMEVKQSDWNSSTNDYNSPNLLRKGTRTDATQPPIDGIPYTATFATDVPPGFAVTSPMRKVKVTINWTEPSF